MNTDTNNNNSDFPCQAIILAGGFGTRLQSVVSDVPKPMAPINQKPFLAYLLDNLKNQGIKRVLLAVGYKGQLVEKYFGDSYQGIEILYSYEEQPLGTGGAVYLAISKLKTEDPVWIFNGDTFFDCKLSAVAKSHVDNQAEVTLALCPIQVADRYGIVVTSDKNRIIQFQEKKKGASGNINAGVYLLNPNALKDLHLPVSFSLEKEFFEKYLEQLKIFGHAQDSYFVDIGIPEDYAKAQVYFSKQ